MYLRDFVCFPTKLSLKTNGYEPRVQVVPLYIDARDLSPLNTTELESAVKSGGGIVIRDICDISSSLGAGGICRPTQHL